MLHFTKLIKRDVLYKRMQTESLTSYHLKTCILYLVENTPTYRALETISGHSVMSGPSTGAIPGLSKVDPLEIAQLVKSVLQQEIGDQVQQEVNVVTNSLTTELTLEKTDLKKVCPQ